MIKCWLAVSCTNKTYSKPLLELFWFLYLWSRKLLEEIHLNWFIFDLLQFWNSEALYCINLPLLYLRVFSLLAFLEVHRSITILNVMLFLIKHEICFQDTFFNLGQLDWKWTINEKFTLYHVDSYGIKKDEKKQCERSRKNDINVHFD